MLIVLFHRLLSGSRQVQYDAHLWAYLYGTSI
jgi:hypothetical protein